MVRTSQRLSGSATKHKRAISDASNGYAKRTKRDLSDTDNEEPATTSNDEDLSDFEDEASDESPPSSEDDYDSDDDRPTPRRKPIPKKHSKTDAEVWREGVSAGRGPGVQVIIKKPKPRSAGKTPYDDATLHPNTFLFLTDLKQNNERAWLKMHDADFRQSERDWFSFVEKLTERLAEVDETIPELPVKDVIFRIYRDVRFSPDPTPYKPHFSAAFSRTGRKGPYAAYYVQIGGEESLVGGGLWHPDAAPLAALRSNIDRSPRRLKEVLLRDDVRKEFLKGAPKNDAKVVKAFASGQWNAESALKTKPKGYDADHADIELLRLRNFTIGRKLSTDEIVGDGGLDRIAELLAAMQPFVTYLNSVVMPDEQQEEDDNELSENDGSQEEVDEEEEEDDEPED